MTHPATCLMQFGALLQVSIDTGKLVIRQGEIAHEQS
jgi:hypothetical protein